MSEVAAFSPHPHDWLLVIIASEQIWHMRQSRPDSGLGFQVKLFQTLLGFLFFNQPCGSPLIPFCPDNFVIIDTRNGAIFEANRMVQGYLAYKITQTPGTQPYAYA